MRIPTRTPLPSVIGTPEMWYRSISSSASETSAVGGSVTGSTIIPASERLTLSTSATWSAIDRLRWTMPIPPSRASAIARRASVTVSIAAETIGMWSVIERVSCVAVETSFGRTCDSAGWRSTSSNVSPSFENLASRARRRSTSVGDSSMLIRTRPFNRRDPGAHIRPGR